MADEVEMTPVAGAEPPKVVNPFGTKPTPTSPLKPGLRLPPKQPTVLAMRPGLKLPPKPGATVSALKPGATVGALRPGLKLPPKPGATVNALRPGLKLPTKPVIHKPGATVSAAPLPKPVEAVKPVETPKTVEAVKPVEAPKPVETPKTVEAVKPVEAPKPIETPKPVEPVAEMKPVEPVAAPVAEPAEPPKMEAPKPIETLKAITQKLKGVTQQIPQQAILRKTGIIADGSEMSESQKEAAKHKTARISLSDAMGVAPVKNEMAPMKTIRIKRPIDIPRSTQTNLKPISPTTNTVKAPTPVVEAEASTEADTEKTKVKTPTESATTITQRKTMKITRPGGAVRPAGKFGLKRPSQISTKVENSASAEGEGAVPEVGEIPEINTVASIPDIPEESKQSSDGPVWLFSLSSLVQAAACVAMGALAWFLYQNTQTLFF